MYTAYQHASPPVWVDVPVTITGSKSTKDSTDVNSKCLNIIADALHMDLNEKLKYSYHKASIAKTHLIW